VSERLPHNPESAPLTDIHIRSRLERTDDRRLIVTPIIDAGQIGSTTLDLRLGTRWQTMKTARFREIDPAKLSSETEHLFRTSSEEFRVTSGQADALVLHPGELLLALSLEFLRLPRDLWGQLEGRSTWARVGLQVHATAGMIDPGFSGYLTFELQNMGRIPLSLYPGLRVGQLAFFPLGDVKRPYHLKGQASYSAQYSVNTKFASQVEHRAMAEYRRREALRPGYPGEDANVNDGRTQRRELAKEE